MRSFLENALTFGTTNEKNSNSVNEIFFTVVAPSNSNLKFFFMSKSRKRNISHLVLKKRKFSPLDYL
jgi:hypothetical protein